VDGFVSLEVSPHLAHDSAASIVEAQRLAACVDRPNLFIKIPGTVAGLTAIEALLYEGININITLLFSVARYEAVVDAWLRALERRLQAGRCIDSVASVASFFLSRVDVLVDQLLRHRMHSGEVRPARLLGRTALANARLAYAGERALAGAGTAGGQAAAPALGQHQHQGQALQRCDVCGAANRPAYRHTMPEQTITAFADHGRAANTLEHGVEEAHQVMNELGRLGIDFAQVAAQLENEGI
jgi:transaldolase